MAKPEHTATSAQRVAPGELEWQVQHVKAKLESNELDLETNTRPASE
jgi:hypothetical protein